MGKKILSACKNLAFSFTKEKIKKLSVLFGSFVAFLGIIPKFSL